MFNTLFFVLVLSIGDANGMESATGEKFEDLFTEFDDSRWTKVEEHLNCHDYNSCIYFSPENSELHSVQGIDKAKPKASELHLMLRNDCTEARCCHDSYCTPYTGGQLNSVKSYGYGSFRFQARAISTTGYAHHYHDVWSCVSIESMDTNNVPMGFSTCIPSETPRHGASVWNYNGTMHDEIRLLPINAGRRFAVYRIDWSQDNVKWYVNGILLMQMDAANWTLPDKPLHIKATIIPQRPMVSPEPVLTGNDMELTFRIRGIKAIPESHNDFDKTELFTKTKQYFINVWKIWASSACILFVIIYIGYHYTKKDKMDSESFYAPLNQETLE